MTFANFIDGGKTLVYKDLLNSEYKASVKMSGWDLITFVGISESWHAFDESRFNISFSISAFEILLNLKYLFAVLLFIATILGWFLYCSIDLAMGSSIWAIFTDLSWYFGIFRSEITLIKIYQEPLQDYHFCLKLSLARPMYFYIFNRFPKSFIISNVLMV